MTLKQISLNMPEILFKASKEHIKEYGYKNIPELIIDLLRNKLIPGRVNRYRKNVKIFFYE